MTIHITSLRSSSSSNHVTDSDPALICLANSLRYSLQDDQASIINDDDIQYEHSRSISTMSLYSDKGLHIYHQITKLIAYYPFNAELNILKTYGNEIASRMLGLPPQFNQDQSPPHQDTPHTEEDQAYESDRTKSRVPNQRWGDRSVGVNNDGVNGGLNGGTAAKSGLVVELGAGSLDKTRHLLRALAGLLKPSKSNQPAPYSSIEYKALDLEHKALVSTLSDLVEQEGDVVTSSTQPENGKVGVSGLHATYEEGLQYLQDSTLASPTSSSPSTRSASVTREADTESIETNTTATSTSSSLADLTSAASSTDSLSSAPRKSLLWLGSSIGNLSRESAAAFLASIATDVLSSGDTILIGIDNCQDGAKISEGYDDKEGVTRAFILEGVRQCRLALGEGGEQMKEENFEYISRWNATMGRHEAYLKCRIDVAVTLPAVDNLPVAQVTLKKDELIAIEVSYKYTDLEAYSVFKAAGLRLIQKWSDSEQLHSLYLLEKAPLHFPTTLPLVNLTSNETKVNNHFGLPSMSDWEQIWKAWDTVTLQIIPRHLLLTKPIDLRHIILFYLGHIPAFADIHLASHFKEELTEPVRFAKIFERGIDPDVNDPTKINHDHSVVPTNSEDWPSLDEILAYESRIRSRLRAATEMRPMTRRLARVLSMLIEHEAMHLETLLYIALQAGNELSPAPGYSIPDFASLARATHRSIQAEGEVARRATISYEAQTIEIGMNDDDKDLEEYDEKHEFGWDVENPKRSVHVPAFTIDALPITNLDYLTFLTSFSPPRSDLFPSSWSGSMESLEMKDLKVKSLYGDVAFEFAKHWPTCASSTQLTAFANNQNGRLPTEAEFLVFTQLNPIDSPAANVGFVNLHPVAPRLPQLQRDGTIGFGSNGGVWEWTSSLLESHEGYSSSILYPGYSSDFFDNAHAKILGGSYLTPPRIAGRRTFVNWYQLPYPYVIAGARVVRS